MTKKPQAGTPRGSGEEGPLVLIVDDVQDNRAVYVMYLTHHGLRVAEAENGEEAVRRAAELQPDVVVMDLSLPVMDGWEATRQLRKDTRTDRIPVIALTGHALPEHAQSAAQAGCDVVITKPCLPERLLEAIRRILEPGKGRVRSGR